MLRCSALEKTVDTAEGALHILTAITLEIKTGDSVAITGASGSGKSTLLGLLAGLDLPSSGKIWLAGEEITAMDEDRRADLRMRHVGFVFQSFQLLGSLTAIENVMLPLELSGKTDAREAARRYLDRVSLGNRLSHYPNQLSGGEQQRVAIARAFANSPTVLFADEPTGNLDTRTGARIIDILFDLNHEAGTTLVLVTHEQRLAELCQRGLMLEDGYLVSDAATPSGA